MPSPQRRISFEKTPGVTWRIHRIHQDHEELMDDRVVIEEPLEILVNGKSIAVLMRLPGQEKELAAGFCITEGYVRKARDILLIHHCGLGLPEPGGDENPAGGESRNRIELSVEPAGLLSLKPADFVRLIRSGCGAADVTATAESLPSVSQEFSVEASMLLRFSKAMRDLQAVHHEVGGTHSAVLFDTNGHAVHLAEDIGRHNAVDKVVGYCLLRKIPLSDKILLTSGRASYEMATKAIRAGIPLIATLSAPTSLAAEIAGDRGLTLVGYLRGGRMNVYTHHERLRC